MPKMKTKSGAKKRFKVTGSGKIKHKRAYHRHIFRSKNAKRGRRLRQTAMVHESNQPQVERMLVI